MKIIADLQLHSRYSRAVSDKMVLPEIARWASLKGIDLVATGDFTHPLWFREIEANLEEVSQGLFEIKKQKAKSKNSSQPGNDRSSVINHQSSPLFILEAEVSSIYTQGGKGRRIHNMIYAPSIETAEKINKELTRRGCNLMSDGRPIIGLTSIELCEVVFEIDEKCLIVPAHIWTPWYSLYGSKSGFDSIEECFGKYAEYIYGIETGLSSDPAMNWRIKELDNRAIMSSSDAHSGPKLGREATIFDLPIESSKLKAQSSKLQVKGKKESNELDVELNDYPHLPTYNDIYEAVKTANYRDKTKPRIAGTIEFYPEEGKYHYTGHRKCKVRYSPKETNKKGTTCPTCGKPLTVGVIHRVEELAGRDMPEEELNMQSDEHGVRWIFYPQNKKPPYTMLVPLMEILSEVYEAGVNTQTIKNEYKKLTRQLGDEFFLLLRASLEDIERVSGARLAQAIRAVRGGDIKVKPGYDGEFGKVFIFGEGEDDPEQQEQLGIFS